MSTSAFSTSPFSSTFNPFLPSSDETLVDYEEVAEAREYALIKSGPSVAAEEVESHLDAVEVKVRWGTQVLALHHLKSNRGFTIGEGGDFVVPTLSATSIVKHAVGSAWVVIPEGATATVRHAGAHAQLAGEGEEIALADGTSVMIELGAVTIDIASVRAGKRAPVGFLAAIASGAAACIGLSFVGHAAIVATLAMFMPKMGADDAESITRDQTLTMKTLLDASAEREQEQIKDEQAAAENSQGSGQPGGEPHKGEAGLAGLMKPVPTKGHIAFQGDNDHVQLSRKEQMDLAATSGMIGILNSGSALSGPQSPFSMDSQLGQDEANKWGALTGATIDDATGMGGLAMWGTGEGGGGKGMGVGLDGIGNLVGNGRCTGPGPCPSWGGRGDKEGLGIGSAPGGHGHVPKPPVARVDGNPVVNGRLPAEVIQRIVRQNSGRFRLCYEAGLRGNPSLTGRVVTKFVIGRDGAVAQASDGGSSLADQGVIGCVVRSFGALSFPEPQGGVATVIYPITLTPGE